MLSNFIYAQKKSLFEKKLSSDEIANEAIVFIEDTKEIWNRGHYFGGGSGSGIDPEVLSEIETAIETLQSDKADKSELQTFKDNVALTYATDKDVEDAVAALVDSAPTTLNTLNELAAALGDDPNFATTITNSLGNKVDKVSGKGLSTNDFTTTLKNKLDSLPTTFAPTNAEQNVQADWNVTDSSSDAFIKNKPTIPSVGNGTVTIIQNGTSKGTFTMNQSGNTTIELTDTNTDTNTHYTTRIYAGASGTAANASASNPYVKITDDNTYRNQIQIKGSGATTVSSDANGVITISSTDTNTHPDLSSYAKKTDIPSIPSLSGGSAAESGKYVSGVTVSGHTVTVTKGTLPTIPNLAAVATSGSYNDLSNKPSIPSAVTESTVSGWGFTKNAGTVTGVKIDGITNNPSNGVVDLGYINKKLSTSALSEMTLSPNVYYRNINPSLAKLAITLDSVSNSYIINEYFVEFTTSSAGTAISLPDTIKWVNGETPTFEASTTYQISIVDNLGIVQKFK